MELPTPVVARAVGALARAGLRPGVSWAAGRRILEVGLSFPPPPRGTTFTRMTIGGVPCEEVRAPGASDPTRALVYFHGGGYVVGSPRTHRVITAAMAAAFGAPVIAPDYRLAPEHPSAAAMDDAHAVWRGLNVPRAAVAGDSAGAGMALELALALALVAEDSDRPAAVGLICPWLDPMRDVERRRPRVAADRLLSPELLYRFATAYFGTSGPATAPLDADLSGLPPLVVHTAGEDTLRDDGEQFVLKARAAGVDVTHERLDGFWHDPHLSAALLGEPVRGAAARMAAALRAHL